MWSDPGLIYDNPMASVGMMVCNRLESHPVCVLHPEFPEFHTNLAGIKLLLKINKAKMI